MTNTWKRLESKITETLYNNQDEHTGQSRKEYHNDNYHLKIPTYADAYKNAFVNIHIGVFNLFSHLFYPA